jgi:parallel beta-helix repeat protein
MKKTRVISIIFGFGVFFWLLALTGEAATTWDCNCASQTIQSFINNPSVVYGDTISVTGICNENIDITKSGIIIDGGDINGNPTAEIHAPVSTQSAVRIRAGVVTVKNFKSIQGGQDGVYVISSTGSTILNNTIQDTGRDGVFVDFGGAPTINHNTIKNTSRYGITVFANAYAAIINNTITNNPGDGILVTESADARIGFWSSSQTTASPNTITANGGDGIIVTRGSNAWIVGNTISNNDGNGVTVTKVSHAGVSYNTINQNGGHGIEVSQGSGANLGSETPSTPPTIFELPNTTTVNNGGRGLECSIGGYVDGPLGTLNGIYGKKSVTRGCVNSLSPPF